MKKTIIQTISFIFFVCLLTLGLLIGYTDNRAVGLIMIIAGGYILVREWIDERK